MWPLFYWAESLGDFIGKPLPIFMEKSQVSLAENRRRTSVHLFCVRRIRSITSRTAPWPPRDSDGKPVGMLDITDLVNEHPLTAAPEARPAVNSRTQGTQGLRLMHQDKEPELDSDASPASNKRLLG